MLPQTLTKLLCSKSTDAFEAEAEDEAVFAAGADVEGVVLHGDRTAVVSVAEREKAADERRSAGFAAVLEVEKE